MTPEGKVKKIVKKALDNLGADCWRFMPVQTGFGAPALDFLLSVRGRFVAIETKAPGKGLTPLQETTKAAIEAAGGIVLIVWDESSLEIAVRILIALEFAPHHGHQTNTDHLTACLTGARAGWNIDFQAKRVCAEKQGYRPQYSVAFDAPQALNATAGRDHGPPRAAPRRPAKPRAGGQN
jgi:hypothetical protein